MARIVSVVSNGCDPDPRVLREARWMSDADHDVTIHAFDRLENLEPTSEENGVKIVRGGGVKVRQRDRREITGIISQI